MIEVSGGVVQEIKANVDVDVLLLDLDNIEVGDDPYEYTVLGDPDLDFQKLANIAINQYKPEATND